MPLSLPLDPPKVRHNACHGPSSPAYLTVCRRGEGTDAARRLSKDNGSRSTATVPSENGLPSAAREVAGRELV